jgi:hypothetical protein
MMGITGRARTRPASVQGANDTDAAGGLDLDPLALLPTRLPTERASVAPAAQEPVTWEYKTVVLEQGVMGWRSEQVDLRALQATLDELGADGWELVQVWWTQRFRGRRGGHLLLLKRPGVKEPATA